MNMMRYDYDATEVDAQIVDSSTAIKGYIYLADEIPQDKQQQHHQVQRTNLLFVLSLVSVCLYFWDYNFFIQPNDAIEPYHTFEPTLSNMLSDLVIAELPAAVEDLNSAAQSPLETVVPEDIIHFIDADIIAENTPTNSAKIILNEVVEVNQDKLNIDKIILSGDQLFKRDRLMLPPEHNAFARYEKVLSVYPNHPPKHYKVSKILSVAILILPKWLLPKNNTTRFQN